MPLMNKPVLIQNGKSPIECKKCGITDLPYISKSHYTPMYKTWLFKVQCAHCNSYIKFINESQEESGQYVGVPKTRNKPHVTIID